MSVPAGSDIYIVSDLHLGEGWLPEKQRYSRLETFFYDADFQNYCQAIIAEQSDVKRPATLVLNGDVFDFLAVVNVPDPVTQRALGLRLSRKERKFGLDNSERKATWKIEQIMRGHVVFMRALIELIEAGHHVVIVRGNHDAELFWDGVQNRIREFVARLAEDEGLDVPFDDLQSRLHFRQWFLYEPGRYYIEHGNQYEASNAFHHVLNPVLPPEYHPQRIDTLDYPMGSLFVRFLYNKMKLLDPFATHFVTLEQYIRITTNHRLIDLLGTGILHFPFFFRAIREARVFELQGMDPIRETHEERMKELSEETSLQGKLSEIDQLRSQPAGSTKYALLKELLRPVFRGALSASAIVLLSLLCWFLIFAAIQQTGFLVEGLLAKASLLAALAVVTVFGLFFSFSFVSRALHRHRDPVVDRCFECAEQISEILDVPNVCMGHTHTADLRAFRRKAGSFANSGTWIPHPGPWDSVTPKARQFTFVRMRGLSMELMRWNTTKSLWEPVTLLEDYIPSPLERMLAEHENPGRHGTPPGAEDA